MRVLFRKSKHGGCLRAAAICFLTGAALAATSVGQQNTALASAIEKVMDRPEDKHANFGIEFYDYTNNAIIYAHDGEKLFVPASTTKILTEGALLAHLGKDYRFHTKIFRAGKIDKK